jgi:WD40 repeat protein
VKVTVQLGKVGGAKVEGEGHHTGGVRVVEAATGKERWALRPSDNHVAFAPDGRHFVVWGNRFAFKDEQEHVRVHDLATCKERWGRPLSAYNAHFTPDGKGLVAMDAVTLRVFNALTGEEVGGFPPPDDEEAKRPLRLGRLWAVSPDGRLVAGRSHDQKALLCWDVPSGKWLWRWDVPADWGEWWTPSFLPGGRRLVVDESAARQGEEVVCLLDAATGKKVRDLGGRSYEEASPDGRWLVFSAGEKGGIRWKREIREADSDRLLLMMDRHLGRPDGVTFSPDGRFVLVRPSTSTVELRALGTGRVLGSLRHDASFVTYVTFSPDGRSVAVGYNDSTMVMWDVSRLVAKGG